MLRVTDIRAPHCEDMDYKKNNMSTDREKGRDLLAACFIWAIRFTLSSV
jgi:hypothetical protein